MKIAINTSFGGFSLSPKAVDKLGEFGVKTDMWGANLKRNDPRLIQVIEELGKAASAPGDRIKIVEIPDDVDDWYITDYDGQETIHEGRMWCYEEEE